VLLVLGDKDTLRSVAAHMTREEGRSSVAAHMTRDEGRSSPPPLFLGSVQERIERTRPSHLHYVLKDFARQLDELRTAGVVEMVFDELAARAGKKACLLGCHRLNVLKPCKFLATMQDWLVFDVRRADLPSVLNGFCGRTAKKHASSHALLRMLRRLGLKTRGGKNAKFPPGLTRKNEPLWHKAYFA